MKINRKYAIRKLAVGVASVSIGLFVANSVDSESFQKLGNVSGNIMLETNTAHAAEHSYETLIYNHYDPEVIYQGNNDLSKGEKKEVEGGSEGIQIISISNGLSSSPVYALGDSEGINYRPYEIIKDNREYARKYYKNKDENGYALKYEGNEEDWKKFHEDYLLETRTKKKILFEENITTPIYKNDGTVILPTTIISKIGKSYYNSPSEYSINSLKAHSWYNNDNATLRNKVKEKESSPKIIKVGNVEKNIISRIGVETDYIANTNMDYGTRKTISTGKEGLVESVTTYEVNRDNGELSNPTTVENTIPMEKKTVEVGTKEKVVYSKKGNDVIKTTTTYELNTTTGEVTPHDNEEVVKTGEVKDKVEYLKVGNDVVKRTTAYKVNQETGEITPEVKDEIIKVGEVKDKVVVEKIVSPVKYEKDNTRDKGKENITIQGKDGSKTTTTTYTVNPKTGEVETHSQEPVIVKPTETIIKVAAKDKVEYSIGNYIEKEDYLEEPNNVYKKTIVYEVNPENGEITENRKVELYKENVMKPKIIKEERIPSPIRYEKDSSRDKGQENITIQGKDGSKITKTVYSLDVNTGEILSYTPKPEITEPTTTTIKVAAKDKVEIVNKKDGSVVKEITTYTVNEKTGEIIETKTEEVIKTKTETSKGDELPPVVENKDFVGGVNPNDAPVVEELPELKVAIIKDNKGSILEVIKENEKPKDIQGYKNTGKTEIDKDGYKVYIYDKVEDKQDSLVDRNKETNKPITKEKAIREENKDNNKETISKKEELPKTSASMLSTVGLFSIFGLRKNRKKDK